MKSIKIFLTLMICLVIGLSLTALAQRAGRSGTRLQPVFVERENSYFDRGWIKKEDGKSVFIDLEGKTSDLGEK